MARILTGTVVSTAMKNTIVVEIERSIPHPLYRKLMKRSKKHKVHITDDQTVSMGQVVKIVETKPISKDKHFALFTNGVKETKETKESKESEESKVVEKKPARRTKKEEGK